MVFFNQGIKQPARTISCLPLAWTGCELTANRGPQFKWLGFEADRKTALVLPCGGHLNF